jgi:hypothetical protein
VGVSLFFFFFFFLSPPNSYFVRIGVAEWLRNLTVTCTFVVQIPLEREFYFFFAVGF